MLPRAIEYHDGRTGPIKYFKKVKGQDGKELDGYSYTDKRRSIVVRATASPRRKAGILLHELIHQAMQPIVLPPDGKGCDIEEAAVNTIAGNLEEMWARNPQIFLWLHMMFTEQKDG